LNQKNEIEPEKEARTSRYRLVPKLELGNERNEHKSALTEIKIK